MAAVFALLSVPRLVAAADIETLLMPGDVISGHADFESECSRCHTRFSKRSQTRLCLDCHEEIDADVSAREGYHGRIDNDAIADCKSCHSEHLGRDADIVRFNPATFDHSATDFALEGRHRPLSCASCHTGKKKYREAPAGCSDCHGEQEPHKGNLGDTCNDCHSEKSWREIRFDHDKTDFRLRGKHKDTNCSSCHLNERYADTADECNNCHTLDDVHRGSNGLQCNDCHNEQDWKKSDFDHGRDTEFALKGRHDAVACEACHVKPVADGLPSSACVDCHRQDDAHHGRYGGKCQACHTPQDWQRSRFDHDRDTGFSLSGKHSDLICSACHRGDLHKETLSTSCFSCHRIDDVHQGQEGEACERCHNTGGWGEDIVFEHDLTRFPLLGLHATTPCEECHLSSAFQDTGIECKECHADDDVHERTLGSDCKQCHNPNAWTAWLFEHNEQTDFTLDGAHQDLHCADCHTRPVNDSLTQSGQCRSCHKQDDVHQGRFGSDCARCHTTGGFQDVQIN